MHLVFRTQPVGDTAEDAYRAITDGTARGKLVIEIDPGDADVKTRIARRSH